MQNEPPDGIIITISRQMLKEKGIRNWMTNFLMAMADEQCVYYMRQGSQPKHSIMWVYLVINGKIRFRANFIESQPECTQTFSDGTQLHGRAWIIIAGPIRRPPTPVHMKGFQGFRYTTKIF